MSMEQDFETYLIENHGPNHGWTFSELAAGLIGYKAGLVKHESALAEIQRWKSAHSNMRTRCALLRQRPDLPVDRIPAYNDLVRMQNSLANENKDEDEVRMNWLINQEVDTIYFDDGSIIDIAGGDLRYKIDEAMTGRKT